MEKKLQLKKKLLCFLIKNYNLRVPIPSLHKERPTSKLQKKPSALKRGHPTFQNMNFYKNFLLLWVICALLDPDPDPDSESGSGSTDPIESGSNPDPDLQPCIWVILDFPPPPPQGHKWSRNITIISASLINRLVPGQFERSDSKLCLDLASI